jgi:hypothetical protein
VSLGAPVDIGGNTASTNTFSIPITLTADVPQDARICVELYNSLASVPSGLGAIDTNGNTYAIDDQVADGASQMLAVLSANATTPLHTGDTITVSWSNTAGSTRVAVRAFYITGVATSSAVDQHSNANQAASLNLTGASVGTATADTIIIGVFGISLGAAATSGFAATAPFAQAATESNVGAGTVNRAVDAEYQIVSVTGTYTPTATIATGGGKAYLAITVAYKAAGGAPPPPPSGPTIPDSQVKPRPRLLKRLKIIIDRPGMGPLDITNRVVSDPSWTTVAVGGFGSGTLTLDGIWLPDLPHLSRVRITVDQRVLFEGYLEKPKATLAAGQWSTSVQAFGAQRQLTSTSIRRAWLARSNLGFTQTNAVLGISGQVGQLDPTNPSISGVGFITDGSAVVNGAVCTMLHRTPSGLGVKRILGSYIVGLVSANWTVRVAVVHADSSQRANWLTLTSTNPASFDTATGGSPLAAADGAAAEGVIFELVSNAAQTPGNSEYVRIYGLRFLYTSIAEDTPGGMYGGTILRDLISLVPGLYPGIMETGNEFKIQEIERRIRNSALSVVQEVAGYYEKEWGVWEDGRFDWRAPLLDTPQWLCTTSDLVRLEIQTDTDLTVLQSIVTYNDPTDQRDKEAAVTSTDQRNPFVRTGLAKDGVHAAPAPMTEPTAALLAAKLNADEGARPAVAGVCVLNADTMLARADGQPMPAFAIRAGENIRIADLPTTSAYASGRDGETLFHIVSTSTSGATGQTTLELEGVQRRADVLLARLAAATRTVTG